MNKEAIYNLLKEQRLWHEITEHGAVYNMEELSQVDLPYPGRDAKNLFVRDDKKQNYYLITVKDDKRVNLKDFKKAHGTRHLSFSSPDDLQKHLRINPGAVTPLGLLNDQTKNIKLFLDQDFLDDENIIGIHPCDNTATIWLKTTDLIKLIEKHGNQIEIINI